MFIIRTVKNLISKFRSVIRLLTIMLIAGLIITGLTFYIFKPTYEVALNGEVIGYTRDKSKLQARINDYLTTENGNVAFIEVENMPEYDLCMLKKNIETNDDEIYEKVINQGTAYYRYYALLNDGEEKYYFSTFEEAESAVDQLKEKKSANADKLTVVEKYSLENATYADVDTCVSELYEKKVVRVASNRTVASYGMNNTGNVINIGISLIRPTTGILTSRFGWRSRDNHKGIDIAAPYGTPIYAAASGTVTFSEYGYGGGYGNHVVVSHGNGVQTLYGHCSSLAVSTGEYVSQGQLIAYVGSTGISTGNHLHLEVRVNGVAQDPQNYVYEGY